MSQKVGLEASLAQGQVDFYKLGYVDHLFSKPLNYGFARKDFETFSISPNDLLVALGKIFGDNDFQAGAAEDGIAQARAAKDEMLEDVVVENDAATKGVATQQLIGVQDAEKQSFQVDFKIFSFSFMVCFRFNFIGEE